MQKDKSYTLLEIRDKLANYCAYQDRCHQEVEKKIKEYNLIPEAEDDILLYLLKENFLNEERYARSYARGKFNQNKWGRVKIKIELKRRNINNRLIQTAMEEIDEEDYFQTAKTLIEKKQKLLHEANPYKKKQRIIRYMLQKGFEYSLINEVLLELYNA